MTKKDFLTHLEEVLEADAGSITGNEFLNDLPGWDSLAAMVFIAMVDEKFNINLSAPKLADSKTVGDLIALLGDQISG
jgi:acyl carrier protein